MGKYGIKARGKGHVRGIVDSQKLVPDSGWVPQK